MVYSTMPRNVTFDELVRSTAELDASGRVVVAIAGAPGSGKSSLAKRLVDRLNEVAPGRAALLEMDGYHYDDHVLIERGLRACKGSPTPSTCLACSTCSIVSSTIKRMRSPSLFSIVISRFRARARD